ncbi:MAG: peptide-methionine (R)-S-oxide reductase MsrB [Gemmatimonadota bacterium]
MKEREDPREPPATEEEWRERLTPRQYWVTREKGTEPPFTGEYHASKKEGSYRCVCCGRALFHSDHKYDSGTGWPSFWQPAEEKNLRTELDTSHGMRRTEVMCRGCGAHLGHLFEDGPEPSGLRYCINSVALRLEESGSD